MALRSLLCLLPALCAAQEEAVPAYLLEVPESVSDVLIAETATATLYHFGRTAAGMVSIDQRYMSIGQNGVGKERAWDRKTPLGIYFITERLDTSGLDGKYGVAAYPLDYPNAWDRSKRRTGDGIWIHGVARNGSRRPPLDTDGCLALPNEEIKSLAENLEPLVTPVIVARKLTWSTPANLENTRIELRIAIEMWRHSLEQSDLLSYLSLYSEDFQHRGMGKQEWARYRLGVFEARDLASVELADMLLIADPEEPGLYLSRFTQELVTATGTATTTKRLYWLRRPDSFWRIVAEDSG